MLHESIVALCQLVKVGQVSDIDEVCVVMLFYSRKDLLMMY